MVFKKYDLICYAYGCSCDEYGKELGVIVHESMTVMYPERFSHQYTGMGFHIRAPKKEMYL